MILTGAGDLAFCAGADLKALAEVGTNPSDELVSSHMDRPEGPMGFTRLTPAKPVIAAISGYCLAGGLELALWCDLRIATAGARLGYPERRWGVPLVDGGTQRLPRIVGLGRALDLILTGRIIEVEEAREWGLVNEIVPAGKHLERALQLAEGLASFPQETMLSDRMSGDRRLDPAARAGPRLRGRGRTRRDRGGDPRRRPLRRWRGTRRSRRGRLSRTGSPALTAAGCTGAAYVWPRRAARCGTRAAAASRSRPRPRRSPRRGPRAEYRGSWSRGDRRPGRSRPSCSSRSRP